MKSAEYWSEHTRRLPPLKIGDFVRIQNQTGQYPRRWEKTGVVIEVRQHDQYVIRVDGSGRVTNRNRKFLRKYSPVQSPQPIRTIEQDSWHLSSREPSDKNYATKESKHKDDITCQRTSEPLYQNEDIEEPLISPQAPPDEPRVEPQPHQEKTAVADVDPSPQQQNVSSDYRTRSGRISKRPDYYVAVTTDVDDI